MSQVLSGLSLVITSSTSSNEEAPSRILCSALRTTTSWDTPRSLRHFRKEYKRMRKDVVTRPAVGDPTRDAMASTVQGCGQ